MSGELQFGRTHKEVPVGTNRMVLLLFVACGIIVFARPLFAPTVPDGVPVEVRGDVPRPGLHLVVDPTVSRAIEAAGGAAIDDPRPLGIGDRVTVVGSEIRVSPASDPLLVGLPIDLNTASADAVAAVPGIGRKTADAIVADRVARGPFRRLDDLGRVPGVGPQAIELLTPFVTVGEVPPLNLDTATVAELEALPGIGPVLAARIVVDRADHGPFRSVDDLVRVHGITPALIDTLRPVVAVGP